MPALPDLSGARILVVKLSSLGDLFHALPAIRMIKAATGATFDWAVNDAYADLVRCFDDMDRVIPFPRQRPLAGLASFRKNLRAMRYDLVLDMQGLLKSALAARQARTKYIMGPSFAREGSRFLYHAVSGPRNKNRHAVEENLDMVKALGLPVGDVTFPVSFPAPPVVNTSMPIGLVPCSRWMTKNWPPAHVAALADRLREQVGADIHLFGASGDREIAAQIGELSGGPVTNHCGETTLPELGGWLATMKLVITVDSGPMHLAAAAGVKTLALFGATDPKRTGPYGVHHRILQRSELPCCPCLSRTCQLPEKDIRCLSGLTPDAVHEAAVQMLGG